MHAGFSTVYFSDVVALFHFISIYIKFNKCKVHYGYFIHDFRRQFSDHDHIFERKYCPFFNFKISVCRLHNQNIR